jgi:hypothetical protein
MPRQREETKPVFLMNYVARLNRRNGEVAGWVGPQNKLVSRVGSARKYGEFKLASAAGSRFLKKRTEKLRRMSATDDFHYEVITVESHKAAPDSDTAVVAKAGRMIKRAERAEKEAEFFIKTLFRFELPTGTTVFVDEHDSAYRVYVQTGTQESEQRELLTTESRLEAFAKAMGQVEAHDDDDILDIGDLLDAEEVV